MSDAIERIKMKIIEASAELIEATVTDTIIPLDEALAVIDEELAKEPQEQPTVNTWVPCSERLPKNQTESWWCTTEYLTCSKDGTIQVLCYSDGWNCSFLNADMDVWRDHEIKSVIAWMPLPSPYTENRKES